jgi:hypothetical protein
LVHYLRSDRGVLYDSKSSVELRREQDRSRSSPEVIRSEQLAENTDNFAVSPTLESLANAVTRSTSVVVRTPRNGAAFKRNIVFEWTAVEGGGITLEILSNKGKPLYRFAHQKSPVLFNSGLKSGLYYWKLEGKSDLLYVGKFLVR